MEKIKTTYKLKVSREDVIEAIKLLMSKHGNEVDGNISIELSFKTEKFSIGYEYDFVKVFDGFEITITEDK